MRIFKKLFNRFVFVSLSIILQICVYALLITGLMQFWVFVVIAVILSAIIFLHINIKDLNPAQQILWICIILLFPWLGFVFYTMLGDGFWSKKVASKMSTTLNQQMPIIGGVEVEGKYRGQANYIMTKARTNAYAGCSIKYFPTGKKYFQSLISDLKQAKTFIFLEYFIIERGKVWNSILQILEQKVKEGVEVKVMYDDVGSVMKLPSNYYKRLRAKGIDCVKFNKYKPFVTNIHNNRDHRKISIIDGRIGYTGGINLADEYANEAGLDFYWKDTGIRIEGNAVNEFTEMFLQLYEIADRKKIEFEKYSFNQPIDTGEEGVVIPFGTGPQFFYKCPIAEETLLNMINQAERELIITTPYLILDYSLNRALASAVARGVDVRIAIPDVPDKKIIYHITKNNAEYLRQNGVKIYKASGSFLHAKSIVADNEVAIVGTINFDYRSFLHHFENAVWFCNNPVVKEVREDTFSICTQENMFGNELKSGILGRLVAALLKIFTPLF